MIKLNRETVARISAMEHYNQEDFIKDAKVYIKALQSGRLKYEVTKVSASGMSRNIKITSFEGTMTKGYYRTYAAFLETLGHKFVSKWSDEIRVKGCGMNMLFYTNYSIIHKLANMKFISKNKCEILSQII